MAAVQTSFPHTLRNWSGLECNSRILAKGDLIFSLLVDFLATGKICPMTIG